MASRKIADLWNIYAFLVNYAIIDKPDLAREVPPAALQVTDRWLLARTSPMLEEVHKVYESYDAPSVIREVETYLNDVSNWYVRVSRRRFWRSGHSDDKQACYFVLFTALKTTVLALSPIIPFVTERIWQNVVRGLEAGAAESVHHADWPSQYAQWLDEGLLRRTEVVRTVIRVGLKLRSQASIRVRQPLAEIFVAGNADARLALEEQLAMIQSELNVKEVRFIENTAAFHTRTVQVDWRAAGAHLRKEVGAFRELFQALPPETRDALADWIVAGGEVRVPGFDQPLPAALFRVEMKVNPRYGVAEEGGLAVALDLEVPDSLKREGMVRDVVRHVQMRRKDAGLSVSQRIQLGLATESAALRGAIEEHRGYIMDEVLAVWLEDSSLEEAKAKVELTVEGEPVLVTMSW